MAIVNNNPDFKSKTVAELTAFVNSGPDAYIGYWCFRNPSAVYQFINHNYPAFGRMANGMELTTVGINNMADFLLTQFKAVPAAQKTHWLWVLGNSMPPVPQLQNWTTPKNS